MEPLTPAEQKGMIIIPPSARERQHMLEQYATVLELGPECGKDEALRAEPGEVAIIAQYAGYIAKGPLDDKLYRIINERDIFAVIEVKENGNG